MLFAFLSPSMLLPAHNEMRGAYACSIPMHVVSCFRCFRGLICVPLCGRLMQEVWSRPYAKRLPWWLQPSWAYWSTGDAEPDKASRQQWAVEHARLTQAPKVLACLFDLRKDFDHGKQVAVDGFSLDLLEDELVALLGHNGCGAPANTMH